MPVAKSGGAAVQEVHPSRSVLFLWFNRVLATGYSRPLVIDDLVALPQSYSSQSVSEEMLQQLRGGTQDLASIASVYALTCWLLRGRFGTSFLYLGALKLTSCVLAFAGPLLLGKMVSYFSGASVANILDGLGLVALLAVSLLLSAVINTAFNIHACVMQIKIKGALCSIVYSKALTLPMYVTTGLGLSNAKLVTLVQVDVDKVGDVIKSVHDLWALPLQILITFVFLYQQVQEGFAAGLAIIVVMIPLNSAIARRIGFATTRLMSAKDRRLQVLSEGVRCARSIKMTGLEDAVLAECARLREEEMQGLATRKYLDAVCVFLWASTPVLVPFTTFAVTVSLRGHISSAEVFTSIALLNMLIYPMNAFPWIVNGLVEARVSAQRIVSVLAASGAPTPLSAPLPASAQDSRGDLLLDSLSWSLDPLPADAPQAGGDAHPDASAVLIGQPPTSSFSLCDISAGFRLGSMYAVVGEVAAGKTSLLLGLLGEVRCTGGRMLGACQHSMAYCPQVPVLASGSVRENITIGVSPKDVNTNRLAFIVSGCQLDKDVAAWGCGLDTELCNGHGVSGGQRARIGVASALYSSSRVVLLDDPFSALDAVTGARLLAFLAKICRDENRLVLIAASSAGLLGPSCAELLLLDRGCIVQRASYGELAVELLARGMVSAGAGAAQDTSATGAVLLPHAEADAEPTAAAKEEEDEGDSKLERTEIGKINASVYKRYIATVGPLLCLLVVLSTLCMQASSNLIAFWYAFWSAHEGRFTSSQFLLVSGGLVVANVLFALLRSFLFAYCGLRAARVLYASLTRSVFDAEISFLESVSLGKLLNRFGRDSYCIDDSLPFMANIVLAQVFVLAGALVVISCTDPLVIIVLLLVLVVYYRLQKYYRATSRELRRLESIHRSPLYTHISDSLANAPTIRSLHAGSHCQRKLQQRLDDAFRVTLNSNAASQWLSMRLQLLGVCISASLALSATLSACYGVLPLSAALLGLSLVYSLSLVNNLNGLVGSTTEMEQEMISVERVLEYSSLPSEHSADEWSGVEERARAPRLAWLRGRSLYTPLLQEEAEAELDEEAGVEEQRQQQQPDVQLSGDITLRGLSMAYGSGTRALRGVSVHIPQGSRVALLGRTGSGKSSLLNVLLRLNDYAGGATIGGRELRLISKKELRRGICVIPQDPLVFSGTVRHNLAPDPRHPHSDDEMLEILANCGFARTLPAEGLLDMMITDGGSNLSHGQRQLLCIARGLLRRAKIVLCDEAASSEADAQTGFIRALKTALAPDQTLILITHKIENVADVCDIVMKLSDGVCDGLERLRKEDMVLRAT